MLEIVPLGGLGEFGMNMMALTWGETTIVVDAIDKGRAKASSVVRLFCTPIRPSEIATSATIGLCSRPASIRAARTPAPTSELLCSRRRRPEPIRRAVPSRAPSGTYGPPVRRISAAGRPGLALS